MNSNKPSNYKWMPIKYGRHPNFAIKYPYMGFLWQDTYHTKKSGAKCNCPRGKFPCRLAAPSHMALDDSGHGPPRPPVL